MKPMSRLVIANVLLVGVVACSARRPVETVMVPPRIDLVPHEIVGVVQFDSNAKGELASLATRRFAELTRQDQGLIRMVDLGDGRAAKRSVGMKGWTPASFKAVGTEHGVRSMFTGDLTVSDVRPSISLSGALSAGSVTAQVDATLAVQLIETATGASLWSRSASATKSVGHISAMKGRGFAFDAENAEEAYGVLVDALVEQVTRDFRVTWVRR